MSVTPTFIGQRYKDTNTGNIWIANSTTPGDWTLELQNVQVKWLPNSARFDQLLFISDDSTITSITTEAETLKNGISISDASALQHLNCASVLHFGPSGYAALSLNDCPNLLDIDLSSLLDIQDEVSVSGSAGGGTPKITSIDLRSLVSVGGAPFSIDTLAFLTSLRLDSLVSVGGALELDSFAILTSLSIPNLTTVPDDVGVANCPMLTVLDLSSWIPNNGSVHAFNGNALLAASVNALLARGVANAGFVSGMLNIGGGTNAAPTGQGVVDKATLIGRGVTVLTN